MLSKSEPLPEGTVIMADDQYAGRGQRDNRWVSELGLNLTFSIFLRPMFLPVEKQFMLNIAVSIGIVNALSTVVPLGIQIKWPNDVYFGEAKIGGVLIENSISGNTLRSSIIGIGINVNQRKFSGIDSRRASSIGEILQADVDLMDVLRELCKYIEVEYLKLKMGAGDAQRQQYIESLYRFGKSSAFKQGEEVFDGKIVDVTKLGFLVVESDGIEKQYGFKEIEFLNKN